MPRENIRGGGEATAEVQVAWGRGGGKVHVTTVNRDLTPEQADSGLIGTVNTWLAEAGMQQIDAEQLLAKSPSAAKWDGAGWSVVFVRRQEVNRLIRTLRKARNRAFDPPEA